MSHDAAAHPSHHPALAHQTDHGHDMPGGFACVIPRVLGKDASAVEAIWQDLWSATITYGRAGIAVGLAGLCAELLVLVIMEMRAVDDHLARALHRAGRRHSAPGEGPQGSPTHIILANRELFVLQSVAAVIRLSADDLFVGWATASLATARAAKRRGARFVLDRACPHVDFQENIIAEESAKLGLPYCPQPAWFRDRQLAEYEEAEHILTPSEYTRATFPDSLRS